VCVFCAWYMKGKKGAGKSSNHPFNLSLLSLCVCDLFWQEMTSSHDEAVQSWTTIKKTEISAQHEFLKPIYLCAYRVTILKYLGVQEKC